MIIRILSKSVNVKVSILVEINVSAFKYITTHIHTGSEFIWVIDKLSGTRCARIILPTKIDDRAQKSDNSSQTKKVLTQKI